MTGSLQRPITRELAIADHVVVNGDLFDAQVFGVEESLNAKHKIAL